MQQENERPDFYSLGEIVEEQISEIEEQQLSSGNKKLFGVSTGYIRLDRILSGLQGSELIILASRPSMGKTSFALNIARNVAMEEQKLVALFTLEMSRKQISMRLLTSEARIDSGRLKAGFIAQEDWQNTMDAFSMLSHETPIFIDDTSDISVVEIRAKVKKLFEKHGELGLVIIDYIQLMKRPFRSERRDLEIAEITRELKSLSKELDIPVMALSQLSRTLEQRADKRPMLSDLRESGALEEDADVVMFIYRDEVYHKEPDNPRKGVAEIIVDKNRNGAIGTMLTHFHKQYTRFEELSSENYQGFY